MWQNLLVGLIVLAALAFTVRRLYKAATGKRAPACGGCASCPVQDPQTLTRFQDHGH
ncbi:MAG: FeoB-associated Cys-rich membrane protein [Thermodesulfobacteriota bacterium]